MSTSVPMGLDTGEQKRVVVRAPSRVRSHPAPRPPRRRRNRQLIVALALVVVAGFLLGLGLPIHP
jgi:hypothetical protein